MVRKEDQNWDINKIVRKNVEYKLKNFSKKKKKICEEKGKNCDI